MASSPSSSSPSSSSRPSKKVKPNQDKNDILLTKSKGKDENKINEYGGWCIQKTISTSENGNNLNQSDDEIQRVVWDEEKLTPEIFFRDYVSKRRPVVLIPPKASSSSSSPKSTSTIPTSFPYLKWTPQYLKEKAGDAMVTVEQREHHDDDDDDDQQQSQDSSCPTSYSSTKISTKRTFGQGKSTKMTFASFIETIQNTNQNESDVYLTTQDLHYDEEGRPSILSSPCAELLGGEGKGGGKEEEGGFPLRPSILGNLIPMTINLWWGKSSSGTSSGLHHDYHDNLYHLIKGTKTFALFSPKDACKLYTVGDIAKVHPNGRICYHQDHDDNNGVITSGGGAADTSKKGNGDVTTAVYADGSNEDARKAMELEKQRIEIEKMLEIAEENGDEKAIQEAEEKLEKIMDQMIDCENGDEEDDFDDEGDDFDDDCDEGDDFDDDDDDDGDGSEEDNCNENSTNKKRKWNENNTDVNETSGEDNDNNTSTATTSEEKEEKIKPRKTPNNFSSIGTTSNWNKEKLSRYPHLQYVQKANVTINEGEALYMPCGWFHEVFSSSSSSKTTKKEGEKEEEERDNKNNIEGHMALNWWVHPPDALDSYENPYSHGFWKWEFQQRKEAQQGVI